MDYASSTRGEDAVYLELSDAPTAAPAITIPVEGSADAGEFLSTFAPFTGDGWVSTVVLTDLLKHEAGVRDFYFSELLRLHEEWKAAGMQVTEAIAKQHIALRTNVKLRARGMSHLPASGYKLIDRIRRTDAKIAAKMASEDFKGVIEGATRPMAGLRGPVLRHVAKAFAVGGTILVFVEIGEGVYQAAVAETPTQMRAAYETIGSAAGSVVVGAGVYTLCIGLGILTGGLGLVACGVAAGAWGYAGGVMIGRAAKENLPLIKNF